MKYNELKRKIEKIAKILSADFSEFSQEDIAKAEKIIVEFSKNINNSIEKFKNKQIPALNKLQAKLNDVKAKLEKGLIDAREADHLCNNIINKMKTKQFYLDEDIPDAEDFKSYTSENERYIDGIMRAGGANEAFECIANVVSRSHQLNQTLSDFQTHYLNKFGNGTYVRTILGKQSANRETLKEFLACAQKRLRTASFMSELANSTRNIMVDLVDAQGKILAHASITSVALRDFQNLHKNLDNIVFMEDLTNVEHPGYWKNSPKASKNKEAGFKDIIKSIFGFLSNLLNKAKKVTTTVVTSFGNLFSKAKDTDEQVEFACDQITIDIEEFKKVFDKFIA